MKNNKSFFLLSTFWGLSICAMHAPGDLAIKPPVSLVHYNKDPRLMMSDSHYFSLRAEFEADAHYRKGLAHLGTDNEQAYICFKRAADTFHRSACYQLAKLELTYKQDSAQAAYWVMEAIKPVCFSKESRVPPFTRTRCYNWCAEAFDLLTELLVGVYGNDAQAVVQELYQKQKSDIQKKCDTGLNLYMHQEYDPARKIFLELAYIKHPIALRMLKLPVLQQQQSPDLMSTVIKAAPAQEQSMVKEPTVQEVPSKIRKKTCRRDIADLLTLLVQQGACQATATLLSEILLASKNDIALVRHFDEYKALETIKNLAEQQEVHGLFAWGLILSIGTSAVDQDREQAHEYFKKAAAKGCPRAWYKLGCTEAKQKNSECALYCYTQALCSAGVCEADVQYVASGLDFIKKQREVQSPYAEACCILILLKCINKEQVAKGFRLCDALIGRLDTEPTLPIVRIFNELGIVKLLHEYADKKSNVTAIYQLAKIYTIEGFKDADRSSDYLALAVKLHHPEAQAAMAQRYAMESDLEQNSAKALALLEASHKQKCNTGTYYLAIAYQEGKIVLKDIAKAIAIMNSPWLDNHAEALIYRAVVMLNDPKSSHIDKKNMIDSLEKYASSNAEACLLIGVFYYKSSMNTSRPLVKKAIHYLTRASDGGQAEAPNLLGSIFYDGKIVTKNIPKAIGYFKKAIELKDEAARFNLVKAYFDILEYSLLIPLAQQLIDVYHDSRGALVLALCYAKGYGVKSDIKTAVDYLLVAFTKMEIRFTQSEQSLDKLAVPSIVQQLTKMQKEGDIWAGTALSLIEAVVTRAGCIWNQGPTTITIKYPR